MLSGRVRGGGNERVMIGTKSPNLNKSRKKDEKKERGEGGRKHACSKGRSGEIT